MSGLATGIASAAISLGGSVGSFIQAGKRDNDMKKAEAAADAAMSEARRRTEVNYMKQLGIQKEAYKQAYEAGSVANKAMIDAAQQQGQRGVAAVAGQVSQAALADTQKVRATQEGEMVARQQAIAGEDSRLRDINVQLDLEEVAGAQQAAEDARIAKNMAIQEGISGLTDAAMTGVEAIALYPRKGGKGAPKGTSDKDTPKNMTEPQRPLDSTQTLKEAEDFRFYDNPGLRSQVNNNVTPTKTPANVSPSTPSFDEVFTSESRQDSFRDWMHTTQPDYVKKDFINAKGKNTGGFAQSGFYGSEHLKDAYEKFGPEFYKQKKKYLSY